MAATDNTDADDSTPLGSTADVSMSEVLGLFDVPAFARRGQELEYALKSLYDKLGRERHGMLDMVRVRFRQWAATATGPDDWSSAFDRPVAPLVPLAGIDPPVWAKAASTPRRRRRAAHELAASVARFNRRWSAFLDGLALDPMNRRIDLYNRYYLLEKECVIGPRLAARNFVPKPPLTREGLLADFPLLPEIAAVG